MNGMESVEFSRELKNARASQIPCKSSPQMRDAQRGMAGRNIFTFFVDRVNSSRNSQARCVISEMGGGCLAAARACWKLKLCSKCGREELLWIDGCVGESDRPGASMSAGVVESAGVRESVFRSSLRKSMQRKRESRMPERRRRRRMVL